MIVAVVAVECEPLSTFVSDRSSDLTRIQLTKTAIGASSEQQAFSLAELSANRVHMGRVNSLKRLRYAAAIGCDSADGTHVTNAPDKSLKEVRGWAYDVDRQLTFWEAA